MDSEEAFAVQVSRASVESASARVLEPSPTSPTTSRSLVLSMQPVRYRTIVLLTARGLRGFIGYWVGVGAPCNPRRLVPLDNRAVGIDAPNGTGRSIDSERAAYFKVAMYDQWAMHCERTTNCLSSPAPAQCGVIRGKLFEPCH